MTHPTPRQLDQWLSAPEHLSVSETLFIRTHLQHCLHCRTYIESLQTFDTYLQKHLTGSPTQRDKQEAEKVSLARHSSPPKSSTYKIAAVIAGIALSGVAYYLVFDLIRTGYETVQQQAAAETNNSSVQKPLSAEQTLADNFSPSPHLDDLVQMEYRSVTVTVTAPAIGQPVRQPILFRWEAAGQPLALRILTNKEKTIYAKQIKTNSYTLQKKSGSL
ncbi:MAG: hypothetical protein HYV29_06585 [Ignavibacteriales bacterium]|nr:hypothetical protein [Ignavibacteriales bacterium]